MMSMFPFNIYQDKFDHTIMLYALQFGELFEQLVTTCRCIPYPIHCGIIYPIGGEGLILTIVPCACPIIPHVKVQNVIYF